MRCLSNMIVFANIDLCLAIYLDVNDLFAVYVWQYLFLFTNVDSCLPILTSYYSPMLIHVWQYLFLFTNVDFMFANIN